MERLSAEEGVDAILSRAEGLRVHARANRRFHTRLSDAIAGQDGGLAFRRGSAMAAHGWHEEGLGPRGFEELRNRPDNLLEIGDATAANPDSDLCEIGRARVGKECRSRW